MTVFHAKAKPLQPELWIATQQLARPAKSAFYSKLDHTLDSFGFAQKVRRLCAPPTTKAARAVRASTRSSISR